VFTNEADSLRHVKMRQGNIDQYSVGMEPFALVKDIVTILRFAYPLQIREGGQD